MEWIVYNEDFNRRVIERINILANRDREIKELKLRSRDYKDFCELLRKEMKWRYWSKCEYEVLMYVTDSRIILMPWVNPRNENIYLDVTDDKDFDWRGFADEHSERCNNASDGIKIDIYDQLRYRWEDFCRYCWNPGEKKGNYLP